MTLTKYKSCKMTPKTSIKILIVQLLKGPGTCTVSKAAMERRVCTAPRLQTLDTDLNFRSDKRLVYILCINFSTKSHA